MKSKTILGADGATKMRQITVGIHRKYTTDIYRLRGTVNAALIVIL